MSDERPPIQTDTAGSGARSRLVAWLQLVRLPNLFTVPGDPLVGYVLASAVVAAREDIDVFRDIAWIPALWAVAASLLLYAAGLISNDLFDLEEDRRDRPKRPLPSGRVSVQSAVVACVVAFVGGIGCAFGASQSAGFMASALALLILIYNGGSKRIALLGPLNMGLCRGFSLLVGATTMEATALTSPLLLAAAGGLTLYIASVTWIAAGETTGRPLGLKPVWPAIIVAGWVALVMRLFWKYAPGMPWSGRASAILLFGWVAFALMPFFLLSGKSVKFAWPSTSTLLITGTGFALYVVIICWPYMADIRWWGGQPLDILLTASVFVMAAAGTAGTASLTCAVLSKPEPSIIAHVIGQLIGLLMLFEAALALMVAGMGNVIALLLVLGFVAMRRLHRSFYMS